MLIDRIRAFAAQHRLWAPDLRVLAAVSGGSDSVAMLFLLRALASQGELVLAGLAHLNHHIRGAAADADAAFCRALAERLEVPAFMGDADVPAAAAREGISLEVAGRQARQHFYNESIRAASASRVAVAHTRDDQAETVLLRLTRGAGVLGLAGIAPRRGPIIRPVLELTRAELQRDLADRGESWRDDETNLDRSIPRNLVRHTVMPQLRAINAQADAALARAAESLRIDAEFLETLANAAFLKAVKSVPARELPGELRRNTAEAASRREGADAEPDRVVVSAEELRKLPAALATRVARFALETANPDRSYGWEEARALCAFVTGERNVELPGLRVERFGADAVLVIRRVPEPTAADAFELRLDVPGRVDGPGGRWTMVADGPMPRPMSVTVRADTVVVDACALGSQLIVRRRRPGDRLHPLGAPGRRKVQDVLVDRKVPRDDRDLIPIVTTETGQIVWVAGQVLAEPFRVTALTESVVVLTLRRS